jgi:hypothetical protein
MSKTSLAAVAAIVAMTGAAQATCSNGTIQGDWAFTVHGNHFAPDGTTSTLRVDGVGIISFDGMGNLVQEDFVVGNGTQLPGGATNPSGFHTGETGSYKISSDCTGVANIVFGPGNEVELALVISKAARSIHTVVSAVLVNGQKGLPQVYSDMEKLDSRP